MSRQRQQEQNEEMRAKILEIARRILKEEGAEAVSVRRITKEIDYSPGIVYHYFSGKEEILHTLLLEGYRRILSSIPRPEEELPPSEGIRQAILRYIEGVLEWPEEYRAVMFSSKPDILAVTSILDADVCDKRQAIRWLAGSLQRGMDQGDFAPGDPVLTAQTVWCAMFGLAARLIIEGTPTGEQRDILIRRHADFIVRGICL